MCIRDSDRRAEGASGIRLLHIAVCVHYFLYHLAIARRTAGAVAGDLQLSSGALHWRVGPPGGGKRVGCLAVSYTHLAIARTVISDAGFGAQFGHSYGHSLGLEIHEAPNCSPSNTSPIPVGAVCSAEPGIYLPGRFGVRIEDVVVFRADGVENLTKSDKQLCILSC